MMTKLQRKFFIALFDDLAMEIEDMGYEGFEDELVNEMLYNHFGLTIEDDRQLKIFTEYILKHQHDLEATVNRACLYLEMKGL
jgi:hypothetical protein